VGLPSPRRCIQEEDVDPQKGKEVGGREGRRGSNEAIKRKSVGGPDFEETKQRSRSLTCEGSSFERGLGEKGKLRKGMVG